MGKHVVVGAGQVGGRLARVLAGEGHEVVVVTRSGRGPVAPRITRARADLADRGRFGAVAAGADVLYNCVNPPYHRWPRDWPPMAGALLGVAEDNGAVLVTTGNLYGYGPVDGPMTEDTPLASTGVKGRVRARMWADALAAHQAGRVRVTEVRGSDYFGPGMSDHAFFGDRLLKPLLAGRTIRFPADPDQPHSFTYLPDMADALAVAGTDERAWGRAWHVASSPALTIRQLAELAATLAGAPSPRVASVPHWVMRAAGVVSPLIRELEETRYQWTRPFVADASDFEKTFGLAPTATDDALERTIAWWRAGQAA
ncbi:NAD-dependent epimerase/dehydratase family protein [Sphaerisporangium sp. TRM90804]|uniref:NAD-dependent epimerase/dehydratase family protein n=1 Tax=Sphaerisporangium sp. TRM90804 TaxID=3031113 RepID=UPI00244801B1|nr:NAD-dependent epimerase/dehydratase family protein [Sphaerisporangium sp. TRM90804]MDH2425039.1 NAD-dependent epimerase/dehydratase family protein [Sphaerisporangium sp. TRM90804]